MFESGDWKGSEDEDDESDDEDDDDAGAWNLEAMRRETERLREQREMERLAKTNGDTLPEGVNGTAGAVNQAEEVVEQTAEDVGGEG